MYSQHHQQMQKTLELNFTSVIGVVLVILTFSALTVDRNTFWLDEITLRSDVVKKSPLKARPHILLGSTLSMQKRWEEAAIQFSTAQSLSKNKELKAHDTIGLSIFDPTSILYFRIASEKELLEQGPDAEGFARLGFLYIDANEHELAAQQFERSIDLRPSYPEPYGGLATIYLAQGRRDKAISIYEAALQHNQKNEDLHTSLGALYMEVNRTNEAITEFKKAFAINPRSYFANHDLALAYGLKGLQEKAREHYRIAESLKH